MASHAPAPNFHRYPVLRVFPVIQVNSEALMRCKVDWSNGVKTGIIVVMRSTPGKVGGQYYSYCAWERASLSSPLKDRSLASRNYLLPSL